MSRMMKSIFKRLRYSVGDAFKDIGLTMDRKGSRLTGDIAYLEPLSRHRTLLGLYDRIPYFGENTKIAPNATLVGEVYIGENSNIMYGAILRGDLHIIRIGNFTCIGDNTNITNAFSLPVGVPQSTNIGNNVKIGNGCSIYSSLIDDNVEIGFKTIIAEGTILERGCKIGPNSYVPAGKLIPSNEFWEGSPVKFVRKLNDEEIKQLNEHKNEIIIE